MRAFGTLMFALALSGCAHFPIADPKPQSDWDRTLYYAQRYVDAGNYFAADRVLDEFVRSHPGTRESHEIVFWKAAYMIDPANNRGSLSGGIAALDGYLAADSTGWYRNEATVLRRTAAVAAGVAASARTSAVTASVTPVVKDTVVAVTRSRDEEIAALRDQLAKSKDDLAKVSAELDRIKKRLANPTK